MTNDLTVTIDTPTDRAVVLTRRFNAPRRLVFDALTKPELVRRWYGPPGAMDICESDTRVGGAWRYVTKLKNGKTVGQFGVYQHHHHDAVDGVSFAASARRGHEGRADAEGHRRVLRATRRASREPLNLVLDGVDLADAEGVTPAFERRLQEGPDDFPRA
jgi:hypothetical protein